MLSWQQSPALHAGFSDASKTVKAETPIFEANLCFIFVCVFSAVMVMPLLEMNCNPVSDLHLKISLSNHAASCLKVECRSERCRSLEVLGKEEKIGFGSALLGPSFPHDNIWRNWKVHSHYPKDFCSSSQLVHQRIFVFARSEQLYVHCFIAYRGVYIIHNSIWYRTCIKFPHYKNGETGAQWLAFNHADYQCYRIQQLLKRIIQLVAEWN